MCMFRCSHSLQRFLCFLCLNVTGYWPSLRRRPHSPLLSHTCFVLFTLCGLSGCHEMELIKQCVSLNLGIWTFCLMWDSNSRPLRLLYDPTIHQPAPFFISTCHREKKNYAWCTLILDIKSAFIAGSFLSKPGLIFLLIQIQGLTKIRLSDR